MALLWLMVIPQGEVSLAQGVNPW